MQQLVARIRDRVRPALGYLISATCSHYDWAQRLIRKGLGLRGKG